MKTPTPLLQRKGRKEMTNPLLTVLEEDVLDLATPQFKIVVDKVIVGGDLLPT